MNELRAEDVGPDDPQWLGVTLSSIGDAVIATDAEGRVKFLNPIAESLTGWKEDEAKGQPLQSVFHIINEKSRKAVETPVDRVLATGRIVDLANHTVLIARDGAERMIDDSAAPIRDEQGQIIGVVLVFRDVSQRRRAEQRRNARLAITQILALEIDIETAATEILSAVCSALQWDAGSFWRLDSNENVVRCRKFLQMSPRNLEAFREATLHRTFSPGISLPGRVWQSRQSLWIPDIVMDPHIVRAPQAEEADLHGAFACPITAGERFLGAIEFFSQRIQPPDDDLLEMMATIGGQFGQFIERREAEHRLRRSEEQLSDFFENANVGLHWVGPDGIILRVNRAELDLLGYSREEYVGRHIAEFHVDQPVIEDILTRLADGEALCDCPARMRAKDGSIRDVRINSSVLFEAGEFIHTRCFTLDVTEANRAEAELRGERARLHATLVSIGDAVMVADVQGNVTLTNPVAQSLTGWSEEEAQGRPLDEVFRTVNEQTRQPVERPVARVLREKTAVDLANHTILITKDGAERPIDASCSPIYDADGNFTAVVLVFRDITDRLRDQERVSSVVNHVVDGIISIDEHGMVTTFNPAAERIFGYSAAEVIGLNVKLLMPEPYHSEHGGYIANYTRTGEAKIIGIGREVVGRRQDGSTFPMELAISVFRLGERRHFTGIVRDITDRKRAEEELRQAEERIRSVVDHVIDGIITIDSRGGVESFNPAAERLFGYAKSEVIGRNVKMLMPEPFHGQHDQYIGNYLRTGEAKIIGIGREVVGRRKDGSTFPMELAVSEFQIGPGRYFTGIVRDITERKRLEQELRQRVNELAEADRRKDHFLATLAHELRNPLAPIRTGLDLMKMARNDVAITAEAQAIMDGQLKQMVRLVDDLLDVSRIASGKIVLQKEHVDLADVVRIAVETVRPHIDEQQQHLTISQSDEPIYLNADPVRLAQAVSNLLGNASKYSDKAGRIWLSAQQRDGDVFVTVRDAGMGIDAEQLPHVFEMFFQASWSQQRPQGGLGIGLSLVKGLIEMHGGSIEASSDGAGMGSEFSVRLPIDASVAHQSQEPTTDERGASSTRCRVLVVDDNRDATIMLARAIQLMGHEAHTAYDGLEGVQAAASLRPDVILLDIGLPNMNGYEVVRHIREQEWGKQMRLIAISGWGQEEDKRRAIEAGFDHHLTKPVETGTLQTVLGSTAR